jgi:hypothetical protein
VETKAAPSSPNTVDSGLREHVGVESMNGRGAEHINL